MTTSGWTTTNTLRAAEIAELPARAREGWDNGTGWCVRCRRGQATRFIDELPPTKRQGIGFFSCAQCRKQIEREGGITQAGHRRTLSYLKTTDARRDRGLCAKCGGPAPPHDAVPSGDAARALAELLNSTVARLSTRRYCSRCEPHERPYCRRHPSRRVLPDGKGCAVCAELADPEQLKARIEALVRKGKAVAAIARELGIPWHTAKAHWNATSKEARRAGAETDAQRLADEKRQVLADYLAGSTLTAIKRRYRISDKRLRNAIPREQRRTGRDPAEATLDVRILALYRRGHSYRDVSRTLGVSPWRVARAVPVNERRPARTAEALETDRRATARLVDLARQHYQEGASMGSLARRFEVSLSVIQRAVPKSERRSQALPATVKKVHPENRGAVRRRLRKGLSIEQVVEETGVSRHAVREIKKRLTGADGKGVVPRE